MTFQEHTYLRRQALSSHWNIEDMVYGAIGVNPNTGKHAINSHFRQNSAAFQDALPNAVKNIKSDWAKINYPHPIDFEDLYERVRSILRNKGIPANDIKGIGLVTLYDISLNIGCNLNPKVLPEKKVYLHYNCVHDSAEKLLGRKIKEHIIDVGAFSTLFPNESAMEIEDILCIYRDEIAANPSEFNYKNLSILPPEKICCFQ